MEVEGNRGVVTGWPVPPPKTYKMEHGDDVVVPNPAKDARPLAAEPAHGYIGAPLLPTGDAMTAGVGPGAWTTRADEPDTTFEHKPKLLPLRVASEFDVVEGDVDPRGLTIYGADGESGGKIVDLWIDMAETMFRYMEVEVEVAGGTRRVLVPINFTKVRRDRHEGSRVVVDAVMGEHFAGVPGTRNPDLVTMLEEEKIMGYFGAGLLYAEPNRTEPLI